MPALCLHTLFEFEGCETGRILRAPLVRRVLMRAVTDAGGTIVKAVFHNFSPYGVSGVVVITESHVTVHTWPEFGYAAVDVLSCNARLNHAAIATALRVAFRAERVRHRSFRRGPDGARRGTIGAS